MASDHRTRTVETDPAEQLAREFHERYERLAPSFGYETRRESAVPWEDVPEQNRALMIAVCEPLTSGLQAVPPTLPFFIEAPGIDCQVVQDDHCDGYEGIVRTGFDLKPVIALRAYDERVLLHEVLHVLIRTDPDRTVQVGADEAFVRHVTRGLYGMGWRWKLPHRDERKTELEREQFAEEALELREAAERILREHSYEAGVTEDALDNLRRCL